MPPFLRVSCPHFPPIPFPPFPLCLPRRTAEGWLDSNRVDRTAKSHLRGGDSTRLPCSGLVRLVNQNRQTIWHTYIWQSIHYGWRGGRCRAVVKCWRGRKQHAECRMQNGEWRLQIAPVSFVRGRKDRSMPRINQINTADTQFSEC